MRLFDLHCDTLTECRKRRAELWDNTDLAVSLRRGMRYSPWFQCFAVWIPDERKGHAARGWFDLHGEDLCNQAVLHPAEIKLCTTVGDVRDAAATLTCGVILTVENGSVLQGDVSAVAELYAKGVRSITLTWNGQNELASGAGATGGLTVFGRAALGEMERVGIIADVSHLNDQGFSEIAEIAEKPFIASHSNARAVCAHPRNLTDAQFTILKNRGGVVGINLYPLFLSDKTDPGLDAIYAHIAHFLALGGENTLCLGSDFDGAVLPPAWDKIEKLEAVADYLLARNLSDDLIDRIFYRNAYTFYSSMMKG